MSETCLIGLLSLFRDTILFGNRRMCATVHIQAHHYCRAHVHACTCVFIYILHCMFLQGTCIHTHAHYIHTQMCSLQASSVVSGIYPALSESSAWTRSPLKQTPWGGLLHLPQSLHGQDLDNINDHTRDLKHGQGAAVTTAGTIIQRRIRHLASGCFIPRS